MKALKISYKILRSILFSLILVSIGLFMLIYLLISVPYFQNKLNNLVCSELSSKIGSDVSIGKLEIFPFNRVLISDLIILDKNGEKCIEASKIGAGIELSSLIFKQKIVVTFAEINRLNVKAYQKEKNLPLNLEFLVEAFKPKEKNKPPTKFDLMIQTIVIRNSSFSYDKRWIESKQNSLFDINHLKFDNIRIDATLPQIKNDDFKIILRNFSFLEKSGLDVKNISLKAHVTNKFLKVSDLKIELPNSYISPSDFNLAYNGFEGIRNAIESKELEIKLKDNYINPIDLKAFYPVLGNFDYKFFIDLESGGNLNHINIQQFKIRDLNENVALNIQGNVNSLKNIDDLDVILKSLKFSVSKEFISSIQSSLNSIPDKASKLLTKLSNIEIIGSGNYKNKNVEYTGILNSNLGEVKLNAELRIPSKNNIYLKGIVDVDSLNLRAITENDKLGFASFNTDLDGTIRKNDFVGNLAANISYLDFGGHRFKDIHLDGTSQNKNIELKLNIEDDILSLNSNISGSYSEASKNINAKLNLDYFIPSKLGLSEKYKDYIISGNLESELAGSDLNNVTGFIDVNSFHFFSPEKEKHIDLSELLITKYIDDGTDILKIESDFVNGEVKGKYNIQSFPQMIFNLISSSVPALKSLFKNSNNTEQQYIDYRFQIANNNQLTEFFNLPIRLLVPIEINGKVDERIGIADLTINIPYLQQGKDKLIKSTTLEAFLNSRNPSSSLKFSSNIPSKNGYVDLNLDLIGIENNFTTNIEWKFDRKEKFEGNIVLSTILHEIEKGVVPDIKVEVAPTEFYVADLAWNINKSEIEYKNNVIDVNNLKVWSRDQYVDIEGKASSLDTDSITISLSNFDLDYLFETLNINHVTFGGRATGQVQATSIFSSQPKAFTKYLFVKDLTYNDALLGDSAILTSLWDNQNQLVKIGADIYENSKFVANVDGGVWVTRDSLSFDMNTEKVGIGFLKPFMAAFSSDVSGRASGRVKLYGTFSDIDLVGKVYADTISMKVDYTNVTYSGKDSVYITPGRIEIPNFRIYDKYGNSGIMTGVVTHDYFHDPKFEFRLVDANSLMAYDTNPKINPDWYGTVFVNGSALVRGVTGMVNIFIDVSTAKGSDFTYVLSDKEDAQEYTFLSFTDKRKEHQILMEADTLPSIIREFQRRIEEENNSPSQFAIDIRASVNQNAKINIIMDPRAGDKITATGSGSMQISYNSDNENLSMYGRYTIDEGSYNFTLQDLIIKTFKIREGSYIAFNGDPLTATLDISAIYRVNTNLADLDKSFSSDRDLNRTNVPVDAVLSVKGGLQNPDISFDIELPTLTQDVERKVKSIISTDDMLNRQVLYLLALNRFYTPEYMSGQTSNGSSELASVASSTISSQISSILGQLSDKWQIAPSFRSDKGDFSDTEFDLALSSRLLNNRLLINGNFGYRDRSNSQTTFIGDFDLEYLLSRSGNLRLKAYNHFNDHNYYLKSSLTTQGIGIIYRREFDNPFSWLRKKKNKEDYKQEKKENNNDK